MLRTPAVVIGALQPLPFVAGKIKLLPVTIGHVLLFDRLGLSPLENDTLSDEELYKLVFVLSRSQQDGCEALAKGKEFFDERIVQTCKDTIAIDVEVFKVLVLTHIRSSCSAFSQLAPPKQESSGDMVTYTPLAHSVEDGNGLSWLLNVAYAYQAQTHCSRDELLDLPLSFAIVMNVACKVADHDYTFTGQPSYTAAQRMDMEEEARLKSAQEQSNG